MGLTKLGWNAERDKQFAPHLAKGLVPARVAVEDKHFYRVWTAGAELTAQVTGRFIHESRRDHSVLPKVGDWVAIKLIPNEEKAAIHAVLPRTTQITRKTSGRNTAAQILATNVETVFLVTAVDPTFNAARLERMLVMGRESGARPVVLLNKIDLCADLDPGSPRPCKRRAMRSCLPFARSPGAASKNFLRKSRKAKPLSLIHI